MQNVERRRAVLTPRNRLIDLVLAGHSFDEATVNKTAIWGNRLLRDRNEWADQNRRGRRYNDEEHARARNALARSDRNGGR